MSTTNVKKILLVVGAVAASSYIYRIVTGYLDAKRSGEIDKLKAIIQADLASKNSPIDKPHSLKTSMDYIRSKYIWRSLTGERLGTGFVGFVFLYSLVDRATVILNSVSQYKTLKYYERTGEVLPGWKKVKLKGKDGDKDVILFKRV